MPIYTKTGDRGTTSLIGGERVPKCDVRVEAYGTLDELSADLSFLSDLLLECKIDAFLADMDSIQEDLMAVEALIAVGEYGGGKVRDLDKSRVAYLEKRIDEISDMLQPLNKFIIPGGNKMISYANICRTVCRRAERMIVRVQDRHEVSESALEYINRLSDYLFVVGRALYSLTSTKERFWMP